MSSFAASSALERRILDLEVENRKLNERVLGAESRLARAAQLYAAVSELARAADAEDVVTVIKEIVANLLGCEEMGIYEVWPLGSVCTYVDGIGLDENKFATLPPSHPTIRQVVATQRVVVSTGAEPAMIDDVPVTAIVPLLDGENVCGLVVLFRMLRQKPTIEPADLELLETLGTHGGRALIHARLRERVR